MTHQQTVRVLIIGGGGISRRHMRAFRETGRAELSLVEPIPERRKERAAEFGLRETWARLDDVDLDRWHAAVICAPAHVHVPIGLRLTDAGVPFLMEKPLAVTLDDVDELLRRVADRRLPARVAYVRRASPETQAFIEQVREGRIGTVRMMLNISAQDFRKYRPDYRETYYARPEMGGGAILDCASHFLDLILLLMGRVAEVASMYDRLVFEGTNTEDSALISLRFASGAMAQMVINQFQKPNVALLEAMGTHGNLVMDAANAVLRFADDDSGRWQTRNFTNGMDMTAFHALRFRRQAEMFLDLIEGRPCPLTTLEEACDNLRVALAAKESGRTGRTVRLDADSV